MSRHNGDRKINPHDLAAARIVAGAMEASNLPPAAARAVFRALNTAGIKPPEPSAAPEAAPRTAAGDALLGVDDAEERSRLQKEDEQIQRAARRIELHQEGLVLALVRERLELDGLELHDLAAGELQGFDYPPTETAPGYREYELQGKPLVRFYSPEAAFDHGDMLVNLRYRIAT